MKNDIQQERIRAVQRFLNGERQEAIYTSLGQSKAWFYKWVERYIADDNSWSESHPSRPLTNITHTSKDVEEIVKMVRLNLYNHDLFCGVQTILCELEDIGAKPLPSLRTINRILSRNGLTHRRTGKYEAKGTPYPNLPSIWPNQTHQADLVGPCYYYDSTVSMLLICPRPAAVYTKNQSSSWTKPKSMNSITNYDG